MVVCHRPCRSDYLSWLGGIDLLIASERGIRGPLICIFVDLDPSLNCNNIMEMTGIDRTPFSAHRSSVQDKVGAPQEENQAL
ncbi:hypothetical protein RRG08_065795 [Elysia crispata]|uniref:Uncharacterized protein n=1 Tax=Elysia crispata TaxID=231223 RepID=A0AAE1DKM5_9GAST|nr:hypothetical protein RRG08_065795 [Elysia crispata]